MFKSIRTRLTTAFLCLAILPILVVGSLLSYKSFTALKEAAVSHQNSEAARISIAVDDYIRGLEHILMLTSQAHKFMNLNRGEQEGVLEELLAYENRFQELSLIANNGMELIRVNRIEVVLEWLLV
ncbi:MAG: hypothetical protein L3J49_10780 [Desulfobulbaceae bacterium]|nr:hypothetical protein [Desulfobulbaceae bacterium]